MDEQVNDVNFIEYGPYVVADKTVYKYDEFDMPGNWTKRGVYRGIKEVEDSLFISSSSVESGVSCDNVLLKGTSKCENYF